MKHILSLILIVALALSICACSTEPPHEGTQPPASTVPSGPSSPTTPSVPSEPTAPEDDLPKIDDWTYFDFFLDGVHLQLPCDFSDFTAAGWVLKDHYLAAFPLEGYTTMPVHLRKGDTKVMVQVANPTADPQQPEQCKIDGIWIMDHNGDVSFEVARQISMKSTDQQVLDAFGTATDETWYGEFDDDDEPTSLQMLRYQTEIGYDQSMTFQFDLDGSIMEITLINALIKEPEVQLPQPPCQHEYVAQETPASCTAAGLITRRCSLCGKEETEEIPATGHSYHEGSCTVCGEKDPDFTPLVDFTITVRSEKGTPIADVIVSVSLDGAAPVGTGTTDSKGVATITVPAADSYIVKLSRIPPGSACKESYTFRSTRANINLSSLSNPTLNDHSNGNYKVGSTMGDFKLEDTDGNSYTLSQLLQEKDLVILNFWYVNCAPCREEFPYFEAIHEKYDNVQLLTMNHLDSKKDILALRQQLGFTFPMIAEDIGFQQGFNISAYPTTVFIAPNGKILKIQVGDFKNLEELEALIKQLT